jgi:hypothetical protein
VTTSVQVLTLGVLNRGIRISCQEPRSLALVSAAYGPMRGDLVEANLDYVVGRNMGPATFFVERAGREVCTAPDDGTFLGLLDEQVAIELQKLRPDLYFIHAAVLERADAAVMLVAQSGGGKSTLCWALLHHGFRYLSDELGPVDTQTIRVYPFPRALALKTEPPVAYPLPPRTIRTSRTLHVTEADIPGGIVRGPTRISAIFFLSHDAEAPAPSVRRLTAGEATARLYENALNPLAHTGDGLDGAIRIASHASCYALITADLTATCALLAGTLERSP